MLHHQRLRARHGGRAFSLNFKVAVPQECVYDRSITSHKVNHVRHGAEECGRSARRRTDAVAFGNQEDSAITLTPEQNFNQALREE